MSNSTTESKPRLKPGHKVTLWVALIGVIGPVLSTMIIVLTKPNTDAYLCIQARKDASDCIIQIERCLVEPIDDQHRINLIYWKKYCQSILEYECSEINTNASEIAEGLYTAKTQIKLWGKS
jgi:hypothetical protein